jgi:hypothetical protein
MRKSRREVHQVHQAFAFTNLGGELLTFSHVHEVHQVHQKQSSAKTSVLLSKIESHCRQTGWTADVSGEAGCIALLPHLEVRSQ